MNWLLQLLLLFFTEKLFVPKCARAQPSKLPGRVGLSTLTELSKREHTLKRIFFLQKIRAATGWGGSFLNRVMLAHFFVKVTKRFEFPQFQCVLACLMDTVLGSNPSGCSWILVSKCTLPVKMFGPFWSVWCKIALAEVGVSLPWWWLAPVLLAPGYWRAFLNLIFFHWICKNDQFQRNFRSKLKFWNFSNFTLCGSP